MDPEGQLPSVDPYHHPRLVQTMLYQTATGTTELIRTRVRHRGDDQDVSPDDTSEDGRSVIDPDDLVPSLSMLNPSSPDIITPSSDSTKHKVEKLDPKLVGMSVGFKNLYSGKEDRHGRFQWQDKIPEDVGRPAEDAETAKWALIVRHVKVYNDPRKTLGIHSIVVQSPLLKKLLEGVLAGYPGVTVGLQRLEFNGKFEPLIHRFPEFKVSIEELKTVVGTRSINHTDQKAAPADLGEDRVTDIAEETILPDHTEETTLPKAYGGEKSTDTDNENKLPITSGATAKKEDDKASDDSPLAAAKATTIKDVETEETASGHSGEISPEEETLTLAHAELLQDVLVGEFQTLIDSSQDMKSQSVMTYEYLWTIFQPGTMVFSRQDGQERVFRFMSGKYGVDREDNPCFWTVLQYVDFDGSRFGHKVLHVSITLYTGTRPISSLSVFPLEFHSDQALLRERLISRGSKVEGYAGTHYRSYDGMGWRMNQYGEKERCSVKGRIIIDALGWNRYNPNHAIYVTSLNRKGGERGAPGVRLRLFGGGSISSRSYAESEPPFDDPIYDECGGGMPMDGHFADDEEAPARQPLTDDQKLMCTPILRVYALKEKQWLNVFVNAVHEITFNSRAFESLVLPDNQKELVLGFTSTQQADRNAYDDVIEGKGRGIIILLCGPPGVGKTLTAESVAEEMKVPLFVMSAGDLGIDSRHIEARLLSVLGMCTRWNAILLLDEAEIFLEKRSTHELERNKIVSIFLRVLEYHEGIMFLTTNRVTTFDPAFHSRIHISLDYPELSIESRLTVWKNFLKQHNISQAASRARPLKNPASAIKTDVSIEAAENLLSEEEQRKHHEARTQPHSITDRQLDTLCLMNMNGRQIKNVLKTAQLLASRKGESLKHGHIETVLAVTQHLHNETREVERTRNSLFA